MNEFINAGIRVVVEVGAAYLLPTMLLVYMLAVVVRAIVYFTTKCEYLFALEFEKRMYSYLSNPDKQVKNTSFHQVTKDLLERTYHEHFELKHKYRRRRFDHVTSITDRMFLVQVGALRLVTDTLSQTRYLQKGNSEPRFLDIAKFVFGSNPIFNKMFGVLPIGVFHDTLNILPGIFVVGGIFGTFLGTMAALPSLGNIDPSNVELTKSIMDSFLMSMTYAMGSSVMGILLSVTMTFLNTVLSPEGMYLDMVNKFTSSLEFIWNDTETNETAADYKDKVDPRTGHAWQKKGAGAGLALGSAPSQEQIQALHDRISVIGRLVDQTESQKGALAPQAWGEQMNYLQGEKRRLEEELESLTGGAGAKAA